MSLAGAEVPPDLAVPVVPQPEHPDLAPLPVADRPQEPSPPDERHTQTTLRAEEPVRPTVPPPGAPPALQRDLAPPTARPTPPPPPTPVEPGSAPADRVAPQLTPVAPPAATRRAGPHGPVVPTGANVSKAPPGFGRSGIRTAASPTLMALDPSDDDERPTLRAVPDAPATSAPEAAEATTAAATTIEPHTSRTAAAEAQTADPTVVGGSRLLGLLVDAVPRPSDLRRARQSRAAAVRLVVGSLAIIALLVVAIPPALALVAGVPVVGGAASHLLGIVRSPGTFGLSWVGGSLGAVAAAGIVVAQMEHSAERLGLRGDPARRLNTTLTAVIALTVAASLLALLQSRGWASASAATTFFLVQLLLLPVGPLPGARAMAIQPTRAWAVLFAASLVGAAIAPTVTTLAIAVLAFTQVRLHWAEVRDGAPAPASPIDRVNRISALAVVCAVLVAASAGTAATALTPEELDGLGPTPAVIEGAPQGPDLEQAP